MILHQIEVSGWRSILQEVSLGPFSEGLNVIHAPNGSGKSSVFEALCRTLFDAYQVSGAEIKAVQPWGRELRPTVSVEFTEEGQRWRVEKAFLSGAFVRLLRFEEGRFAPLADGKEADIRIRELLAADAPGRGLSKQEHWGLAQVLWAPQGNLQLGNITGSVAERLRAAMGVQVSGESGGRLDALIAEHFQRYFTASGSGYRKGKNAPPIIGLEERRSQLQEQVVELRAKQQDFEEASRRVEDARSRRDQAKREADGLRERIAEARTVAERYRQLQAEAKLKREQETLAHQRYQGLIDLIARIAATRKEIADLETALEQAEKRQVALEAEVKELTERVEQCRREREQAREKRAGLTGEHQRIQAAREYLEQLTKLEESDKQLAKLAELEKQLAASKAKRSQILAPDVKLIRDLRSWLSKREQAEAALAASQVHLTLTPEQSLVVRNLANDTEHKLDADVPFTLSADEVVEVKVAGVGRVRAAGPEGGAEAQRNRITKAEQAIAALIQPYGTSDPDQLQLLREQAERADREIEQVSGQISAVLEGRRSEELAELQQTAAASVAEFIRTNPQWQEQRPVIAELQKAFDVMSEQAGTAAAQAEDAFDRRQAALSAAEKELTAQTTQIKADRVRVASAQQRLSESVGDGRTDAERDAAQSAAAIEWAAAREQAGQAESALNDIPGDPVKEVETLEKQRTALETAEGQARDEEKTVEGQLQALAGEGAYSKLIQAEEELEELGLRIEQEEIRMDAIHLLHSTVSECKQALVAKVAGPVEERANRMFSEIVGPRLGKLTLSAEFAPDAVLPQLAAESVALSNLSGGEQEQLFLAVRLALASVLAKEQRQLVVLDDVLNATDSARHTRVLNLLDEAADQLQIIILTCHPERYRALDTAEFFELKTH